MKKRVKTKKVKRVQFELVTRETFYDALHEAMASQAWDLDLRRKPEQYIR